MRTVRWVQLALVGGSAAVLGLVVFYAIRAPGTVPPRVASANDTADDPAATAAPVTAEAGVLERGSKVKLDRWVGADRRFTIEAPQVVSESEQLTVLSGGVKVNAVGADGLSYAVDAAEVRGEERWQRVRAEGAVRIVREDGLTLSSEWAAHYGGQQKDQVGGAVRVRMGDRLLAAERVEYRLETEDYLLDGGVSVLDLAGVDGAPALATARHLQYTRKTGALSLRGAVELVSRNTALSGETLDARLADNRLMHARLSGGTWPARVERWSEQADPCAEGSAARAALQAPFLVLLTSVLEVSFDDAGNPVALESGAGDPVWLDGLDPPRHLWSLTGSGLQARLLAHGRLEWLKLDDVTWLSVDPGVDGPALDRMHAAVAIARFTSAGSLEEVSFPQGIELVQGGRRLSGDQGLLAKDTLTVTGSPRLSTAEATLSASSIEVLTGAGEIRAQGGVETEVSKTSAGLLVADGERVRFRADTMETARGGASTIYRGHARAWNGADVLQADEIRADKQFAAIEAEGSVTALLASDPERRMQASSDRLRYGGRSLVLEGSAVLVSPSLTLSAERVTISLGEDGRSAERLEAVGEEVIVERMGVRAQGRRVVHEFATERSEISAGDTLVRVVDADGQESWGARLTLWRQGERVVIDSREQGVVRSKLGAVAIHR